MRQKFLVFFTLFLWGAEFFCLPLNFASAASASAVINEVSVDSLVGTGGTDDDWVELYNPTDAAISLSGCSLQKTTGTGGSLVKVELNGEIAAKGYFLVVRNGATTAHALKNAADIVASDLFSLASNNIVYLVNDNINITDASDSNIVDFVGWGTASFYEGSAAAPAIAEAKSISRMPNGNDTDQNFLDFILLDIPTPTNSEASGDAQIGGTVLLTIVPDSQPVQNITPTGVEIVFQVNSFGTATVNYGLTGADGSSITLEPISANITKTINLSGLACATTYHYSIYAENVGGMENDATADATFTTLPCGITVDSQVMTKTAAKANNQYQDGWQWKFDLTIWNINETVLKMKFDQWNGSGVLDAANNMQYSVNNGTTWNNIDANGSYPIDGVDISGIDESASAGRQVVITVRMKVPAGTLAGTYNSTYGILTE